MIGWLAIGYWLINSLMIGWLMIGWLMIGWLMIGWLMIGLLMIGWLAIGYWMINSLMIGWLVIDWLVIGDIPFHAWGESGASEGPVDPWVVVVATGADSSDDSPPVPIATLHVLSNKCNHAYVHPSPWQQLRITKHVDNRGSRNNITTERKAWEETFEQSTQTYNRDCKNAHEQ